MTKEKSAAEANTNLITQEDYIAFRKRMQGDTHVARLLDYLWHHGKITSMECFSKLGNTRISATVGELRHRYGVPVITTMVEARSTDDERVVRYGIYSIERGNRDVL